MSLFSRLLAAAVLTLAVASATAAAATTPPFYAIDRQAIPLPKGFAASTPIWTKDGHHLLFSNKGQLYRIGATGKGLTCLTCSLANDPKIAPGVQEAFKDVFPDGKRILWGDFTRAFVLECAPSVLRCTHATLLPIDVAAAAPAGGAFTLDSGVWHLSPDGQHLGWTATRLDTRPMLVGTLRRQASGYVATDVKVVNPPGITSLTDPDPRHWTNAGSLYELKGFADGGRSVTYVNSQEEGNPDVYSVDLRTGARTRLTANPDWDEDNGQSPDGALWLLHSDRGMHRVDAAGLLPRRSFVDYPISANAAIYYVGTPKGFQCDLQPWLLPASGDDDGRLLGQPLDPYDGGDVHAQNNVPGRGAWSPDSTRVALTEMSYKSGLGIDRLLVARLHRAPTRPERVVSSAVGPWAATPATYRGAADANTTVTLHGLKSGTAIVTYSGTLANGTFSVVYDHYSDDGASFLSGTESLTTPGFGTIPATSTTDLKLTGKHTGSMTGDFTIGRADGIPSASGGVDATYDGYRLAGDIPALGACPTKLPRRQPLKVAAHAARGGVLHVTVTADSAPSFHARDGFGDLRPVAGAVVRAAGRGATTDAHGHATLRLGGASARAARVRATAGDTFTATSRTVRVAR
jgi:hypothetical protein